MEIYIMAGSLKKKPGMGHDKAPGEKTKAQPGKKKKRTTPVKAVKKSY